MVNKSHSVKMYKSEAGPVNSASPVYPAKAPGNPFNRLHAPAGCELLEEGWDYTWQPALRGTPCPSQWAAAWPLVDDPAEEG